MIIESHRFMGKRLQQSKRRFMVLEKTRFVIVLSLGYVADATERV